MQSLPVVHLHRSEWCVIGCDVFGKMTLADHHGSDRILPSHRTWSPCGAAPACPLSSRARGCGPLGAAGRDPLQPACALRARCCCCCAMRPSPRRRSEACGGISFCCRCKFSINWSSPAFPLAAAIILANCCEVALLAAILKKKLYVEK